MGKYGLQLWSVKESAAKDLISTVSKVADMGYEAVQFAGFHNVSAKELKKVLDEKGLLVSGSHTGMDQLSEEKIDETLAYNNEIGNDLVIVPFLHEEFRGSADAWKRTAERFNRIGEYCKKQGFTFGYHNHAFEFEQFDGITGFELLFDNSDAELVKVELDCYWVSYAGLDPVAVINKYKERCMTLHIKDMTTIDGKKQSTEVGNGTLDITALLSTGSSYNVPWFIVEQEQFERDPMESVAISIKYLKSLA